MKQWISSAVIYQVNLRAFAAREPRNPVEAAREKPPRGSPLAFLAARLPALRRLGANVVYLMPPYAVGVEGRKGIGSPYAIRDFKAVDPEHGTNEEFAELVRRAHALGLCVILDITPNHTSRDHRWTAEHPEYYVRRPDGSAFFDWDWSDTAKLDYRVAGLRRAMLEVYDFWLRCAGADPDGNADGVDGFRLDMAHLINDRSFWDEAIPELRRRHADRELLFLAECYGTANNLDLFARGINAAYDDDFYKLWLYAYGVGADGATRLRLSPQAEHNADFRDKLDAFRAGGLAAAAARALQNYERGAPGKGPWLARYTDNHDEGRGLYRFGAGGTRAAMRLAFLSGHCLPFLLAGQEFGALNRPPIHERIGPCDKGRRRLDDRGEREEAGVEFEGNLFARGRDERQAWRAFYRELIQLRRARRELREGAFATLDAGEEAAPAERTVLAFERRLGRRALRCAVNLGPEPRRLARADRFAGRWLYGRLDQDRLGAFEAVVAIPAEGR